MDSIVKYVVSELSVIAQAPVAFALCLIVLATLIWKALSWRFAASIDGYEARNKLQADQIGDYKAKLSGATPDEARSRIDALEAKLRSLEPRTISPQQVDALVETLSRDPGRANVTLSVMAPQSRQLFSTFERCFERAGYAVKSWVTMDRDILAEEISLLAPDVDRLTARQRRVLDALRALNLNVGVRHQADHPANDHPTDIWLVIR